MSTKAILMDIKIVGYDIENQHIILIYQYLLISLLLKITTNFIYLDSK
jgi:hypothetical protein